MSYSLKQAQYRSPKSGCYLPCHQRSDGAFITSRTVCTGMGASSPERDARRVEVHRVFREARAARVAALGTFSSDARAAITANPEYFVWWYTAKSLALVGALGWVAYLLGKNAGRKERRG